MNEIVDKRIEVQSGLSGFLSANGKVVKLEVPLG
tara:strand:- start:1608 stop:1709 length:102 start_codon:yes stop_codon:yes gene_type:complete